MKICVASETNGGLEDMVSSVFGRCSSFTVVEIQGDEIKNVYVVSNPGAQVSSGAGIQAAQAVINEGCSVIISSSVGPNSGEVFRMGGVKMYSAPGMKIEDAVHEFIRGELPEINPQGSKGPGMGSGRGRGGGRGMGRGRGSGMGRGGW